MMAQGQSLCPGEHRTPFGAAEVAAPCLAVRVRPSCLMVLVTDTEVVDHAAMLIGPSDNLDLKQLARRVWRKLLVEGADEALDAGTIDAAELGGDHLPVQQQREDDHPPGRVWVRGE